MLVAELNGQRVEASSVEKGPAFICPNCGQAVVLKKGKIVIHHFSHKPPITCTWGAAETREHREAKKLFQDEFIRRGCRADVEYVVNSLSGDRRSDVMIWSPSGKLFALELQHSPADYDELYQRTRSYVSAGIRVIWIPFLAPKYWKGAVELRHDEQGDYLIKQYPARPLDKWVHGFGYGELWMYDPARKALWKGKLKKHQMYVNETARFESDGSETTAGGYWKISRRWRELTLWGPYGFDRILISAIERLAVDKGKHSYPGGYVGRLQVGPEAQ